MHEFKAQIRSYIRKLGQKLPVLMLIVGASLCVYVLAIYARAFTRQRRLAQELREEVIFSPRTATEGQALAELVIPKIGLDAIVVEGTASDSLRSGPGHLETSAGLGLRGNAVVAGHRDTFFRSLDRLAPGDPIYVARPDRHYRYAVTETKIVSPSDISVLEASRDTRLTLVTCYPMHYVGPAPKRLIVIAQLRDVESSPDWAPSERH